MMKKTRTKDEKPALGGVFSQGKRISKKKIGRERKDLDEEIKEGDDLKKKGTSKGNHSSEEEEDGNDKEVSEEEDDVKDTKKGKKRKRSRRGSVS